MDKGLKEAIKTAGGVRSLARALDIRPQSISQWTQIPSRWIIPIEKVTGVPRETLRPDLYLAPRPKLK